MKRPTATLVYEDELVRLYHGDGVDALRTWEDEPVGALICDPPYSSGGAFRGDRAGQSTKAKYQQHGQTLQHANFSGDNRDQRSYTAWLTTWLSYAREVMLPGAPAVLFSDWRQVPATTDGFQGGGLVWRGLASWDKTEASRPVLGRPRAQCEYLIWGSNGPMPTEGPALPGCWRIPVARNKLHLTEKPLDLLTEVCRLAWRPEGVVLDPFAGSATTLAACKLLGRKAVGFEIDDAIVPAAVARLAGTALPSDEPTSLFDLLEVEGANQ